MTPLLTVLPILSLLGLFCWIFAPRGNQKNLGPLPPGPPADPIIGHVRRIPANRPELAYMKWGKEYNTDILYVDLLGNPTIILNSVKASTELLERRGAKYSDRPGFHFLKEQGFTENLGFYSTGPQFKKHRKMFQNAFTTVNCMPYREAQQQEARKLIGRILKTPDDWRAHFVMFATVIVLRIAYGLTVKDNDDPYLKLAEKVSYGVSNGGSAGATMVDVFPLVRYLPKWLNVIPSLKFARGFYPYVRALRDLPFSATQTNMAHGIAETSFTKKMLEEKDQEKNSSDVSLNPITDNDIKGAAATIYIAGQDTSHTTLTMFILNMTRNPEIQQKAWKEIESVIGADRLPTFADRDKLPYVECIMQETFRQNPVAPLGVPHVLSEDDTYNGYFIPAGSTIYANAYAMLRDEALYNDPETFNPDRFLPRDKGGAGEPLPVGHFGFGRRICPGRHLALNSIWIVIATILATLEISKAKDADGNDITPDPKLSTGLVSHPDLFPSVLKPRSSKIAELVGQF